MDDDAWASDWFPRALSSFLSHEDALRLAVCALLSRRVALSRALLDLAGPLAPISIRALVICAVLDGDWDAVVALQRRCKPSSQRQRKRKHLERLDDVIIAIEEANRRSVVSQSLRAAIRLQRCHPVQLPSDVLYRAAHRGRLGEVVWLADIVEFNTLEAIEAAARGGHPHVVQWLLDTEELQAPSEEDDSSRVLEVKRPSIQCRIRLDDAVLAEMGVITWREEPRRLAYCYLHGHKFFARHQEFRSERGFPLMDWAASQGDLIFLKRLSMHPIAKGSLSWNGFVLAASSGHLDVVKWLWDHDENLVATNIARVMAGAARRGNMEMLEWMLARIASWDRVGSLSAVFEAACDGGHLPAVQWAFQHCLDERIRPRYLLMTAACAGYADIVRYLHEEQGYTVRSWTVGQAVTNGHLHVAQWLYERSLPTISTDEKSMLVPMAVKSGQIAVLKWLVEDLNLWSDQAIENAAWIMGDERVAVLDYLWARDQTQLQLSLSRVSFVRLLMTGRVDVVEWILQHIPESATSPIAPEDAALFSSFLRLHNCDSSVAKSQAFTGRKSSSADRVLLGDQLQMTKIVVCILQYRPRFCCAIKRLPVWAAVRGCIEILEQLEAIGHPDLLSDRVLIVLLRWTRNADVVLWVLQRRSLSAKQLIPVVRWAARYCALSVLQHVLNLPAWTSSERFQYLRASAWYGARYGHSEVVQFVHNHVERSLPEDVQKSVWRGLNLVAMT